MKYNKSKIKIVINSELKALERNQTALLEQNLKTVQKGMNEILLEVDENIRSHLLENRNNIFIPVLDENTGAKTYKPQDIDEFLAECQNDKTKSDYNRYDHVYDALDESFAHESSIYFGEDELLSEVDWEKRAAELETGEETEEYTAAGEKKGLVQRTKEKAKGTLKKGRLYFFLKIVEAGLKTALAVSRGVFGLIRRLIFKAIKPLISAWVKGKQKAVGVWAKIKEWGMATLPKVLEKIMKPFFWIATKLTSDGKKAADLAPLIASITMLSLMLAWIYFTGGLDVFNNTVIGVEGGMQAVIEQAPEELAAGMCIGEARNRTAKQLLAEECEFIDEQGREVSNAVMAKVMQNMTKEIQERMGEAKAFVDWSLSHSEGGVTDVTGEVTNTVEVMNTNFDQTYQALRSIVWEARETDSIFGNSLDLSNTSGFGRYQVKWAKIIQDNITAVQKSGEVLPDLSDEEMMAYADSFQTSYHVKSVIKNVMHNSPKDSYETVRTWGSVALKGVRIADAPAEFSPHGTELGGEGVPSLMENLLTENQVRRFKDLAGV